MSGVFPRTLAISVGQGKRNATGRRLVLAVDTPSTAAIADLLRSQPAVVEAWWSPHVWENDYRTQETWRAAAGVAIDIDYYEPGGKHAPAPAERAEQVEKLATSGALPGSIFHLTPRGFRIMFVFEAPCTDGALFKRAAEGAAQRLKAALRRHHVSGYRVDESALFDRARMLYCPRAIVDGVARSAAVYTVRHEPFAAEALAPAVAALTFEEASIRYNNVHQPEWPMSGGTCPACGHHECFGQLDKNPRRWACFSASHDGVGIKGPNCWHGDALDLDAVAAGSTPAGFLRREGYLSPASVPDPIDPPGDESTDEVGAEEFRQTDTGNAERLVARFGQDIRFCHAWNKWLFWDGQRWMIDSAGKVLAMSKVAVRDIYAEAGRCEHAESRKSLASHASKSERCDRRKAMVALAAVEPGIPVSSDALDSDPWALNVRNGTVDLRTGRLQPHGREGLCTKLVNIDFNAAATCPRWLAFLEQIMAGRQELVAFLRRCIGHALSGDVSSQSLFFLHGTGANGKSTLLDVVLALLGEYGKQAAPDLLIAKRLEAHPTGLATLLGCRVAVCQEVGLGRSLDEAVVKQLTGGDRMTARFMRADWFEFTPTHKIFLAANHKPQIRGTDEGIWRRIKLIPFDVTVLAPDRDPHLPAKLRAELPGILNWAVQGCLEWVERGGGSAGLAAPDDVLHATADYRAEEDELGQFLTESCDVNPRYEAPAAELFAAYTAWCEARGDRTESQKIFGRALGERGFTNRKTNGRKVWTGLRLRSDRDHRGP
jgi:P4 family phage/plasmid primase-like protien